MIRPPAISKLLLLAWVLGFQGCAVMDRDTPPWSAYRQPDDTEPLQLARQSVGDGDPILLIHGFGASSYSWRHFIGPLSSSHRVIALDLKGFGDSPKPRDNRYSVYEQARLVRNFILENELSNLHIVGHSYGGGVALATSVYLAGTHPGLQRSLTLIDSIAYPQELPGFIELLATPLLGPILINMTPGRIQVRSLLKKVYFNDELIPEAAVEHYAENLGYPNAKYAALTTARQLIPEDLMEFSSNYSALSIPVLIVWGGRDEIVPLDVGERLHEALQNSRLVVLDNVGHAVQEERPYLVLPYLREFLESGDIIEPENE